MKKNLLFFAILLVFSTLLGCKVLNKLTQFDVPYSTSFTIPAAPLIGLLGDIYTPDITTNSEQTFSGNNTAAHLIQEVTLKSLKLTITSPQGKTFDFLKSAEVYISAGGLPEVKIASIDNINDATVGNTLNMIPSGGNLKEYLKKDVIKLTIRSTTDKVLSQSVEVKIDAVFLVDAKILGV